MPDDTELDYAGGRNIGNFMGAGGRGIGNFLGAGGRNIGNGFASGGTNWGDSYYNGAWNVGRTGYPYYSGGNTGNGYTPIPRGQFVGYQYVQGPGGRNYNVRYTDNGAWRRSSGDYNSWGRGGWDFPPTVTGQRFKCRR